MKPQEIKEFATTTEALDYFLKSNREEMLCLINGSKVCYWLDDDDREELPSQTAYNY